MNSSDFLKIDPLALDKEWLGQPALYFEYAEKLADARRKSDEAKSNLDLVYSELSAKIRSTPDRFGVDKVTESAVSDKIKETGEYRGAQKVLNDAKYKVDIMQAAVTALDHRKRALTMLVELHGQNYFSDPKITSTKQFREVASTQEKKTIRSVGRLRRKEEQEDDE